MVRIIIELKSYEHITIQEVDKENTVGTLYYTKNSKFQAL